MSHSRTRIGPFTSLFPFTIITPTESFVVAGSFPQESQSFGPRGFRTG
jgi:hypothetical protein